MVATKAIQQVSMFSKIYDEFFKGLDPSKGAQNFWNTLFLLRVDVQYLENKLSAMTTDDIFELKETINCIFYHCVESLDETNPIRIINSMQTLSVFVREITKKLRGANSAYDQMDVLIGFDSAEIVIPKLIRCIGKIISGSDSMLLKKRAVRLALVVATTKDNVNQNPMLDYFMRVSIFESLCELFSCGTADRTDVGTDAVILLLILINYRKYDTANPYAVKLSILDNELALNGLGQIINKVLQDFNANYSTKQQQQDSNRGGFFFSVTNAVTNLLVGEDKTLDEYSVNDALLFALYEGVQLNRNLISVLTRNHSDEPVNIPDQQGGEADQQNHLSAQGDSGGVGVDGSAEPSNILVSFFEYMSYIMNDTKDPAKFANSKLCLIIVTCIVEDQYANTFLHDSSITFRVNLYQPPMRHKKPGAERPRKSVPLVVSLLDLLCNFISTQLKKSLPYELHAFSLAIVYRIICHQKKNKIRLLGYQWQLLWQALIVFLKFLVANSSELLDSFDIFHLAFRAVGVLNLFITFGDAFLPSPSSYDELYYEILRMYNTFDDMYAVALQHVRSNGNLHESAARLMHSLTNIRSIIAHFNPRIKDFQELNNLSSLSIDQVLGIVRDNYDSLALRMQDSLDHYDRYTEKPHQVPFFSSLMRTIIHDCRVGLPITTMEQQELLDSFSTLDHS
ncbi:armadillo-like helical domain-containing protein 3 [Symsagittifera roscoffensis]|uniref:armadillo-like helical domain-containing protein 3 n=1 Tax=Symsagittifera roscoffensis TaxID=84072 RepID=UPI00307CAB32